MQAAGIDIENPNVSNIIVPEEVSEHMSSNNLVKDMRKEMKILL